MAATAQPQQSTGTRVVRYRDDKTAAEADTIDAVRAIAIRDGVVPEA